MGTNKNQNTDPIRPDPIEDSDGKDDFTEGKRYIEEVHKITSEGDLKPMSHYAIPKDSPLKRIFDTALETLAGTNKAGKVIGKGKNLVKYVIPYGDEIDAISDKVGDVIRDEIQTNQNDMAQLKEGTFKKIIRFLKQESTRRGLALVAGLLGAWLGFEINPENLVSTLVSGVTGASLIYASWKNIKDIFVDEDNK